MVPCVAFPGGPSCGDGAGERFEEVVLGIAKPGVCFACDFDREGVLRVKVGELGLTVVY